MSVKNTESKCNLDIDIRKSTHVTSEMHGYACNFNSYINSYNFNSFINSIEKYQ